jgi:hypothetical protein
MSVCKPLRIRWVQFAKTWGHVSSVSIIGNMFFGLEEMFVNSCPCIEHLRNLSVWVMWEFGGSGMVYSSCLLFQKVLERLWSNEVLFVHL